MQHVSINKDREHAKGFIILNDTRATHVCGQIIDVVCTFGSNLAVFLQIQIERQVLYIVKPLVPFSQGLDVHRSYRATPRAVAAQR